MTCLVRMELGDPRLVDIEDVQRPATRKRKEQTQEKRPGGPLSPASRLASLPGETGESQRN